MTPGEGQALCDVVGAITLWRAEDYQGAFDAIGIGAGAAPETNPVMCCRALLSVLDYALDRLDDGVGELLDLLAFVGRMQPLLPEDA